MNCENLKKGDKVIVRHESFLGVHNIECIVEKVYKKKIRLSNGYTYWKDDGKYLIYSPFSKNEIIKKVE